MRGRTSAPRSFQQARAFRILATTAALGLATLPSQRGASAQERAPQIPPELEALRTKLSKYQDLDVALRDLYNSPLGCIEYARTGGHGQGQGDYRHGGVAMHMMDGARFMDNKVDPERPEVLIYEQTRQGEFRLAGAVWMLPADEGVERPKLFGQDFEGPIFVKGRSQLMPVHFYEYDLYVWLWKDNPAGLFSPTNPNLPCPKDGYTLLGTAM